MFGHSDIVTHDSSVYCLYNYFILLRTYAGGVHLNSYFGCFICSVSIQTLVLLVNEKYIIPLPVSWGIIFIGATLTLINAPVENINRELDKEEKNIVKRLRSIF